MQHEPVACHTWNRLLPAGDLSHADPPRERPHPRIAKSMHAHFRTQRMCRGRQAGCGTCAHNHAPAACASRQPAPRARLVHVQVDDHALLQRAAGRFPHPPQRQRQVAAPGGSRASLPRPAVLWCRPPLRDTLHVLLKPEVAERFHARETLDHTVQNGARFKHSVNAAADAHHGKAPACQPLAQCSPCLYRHQPPSLASSQYAWCCPPPMLIPQPCSTASAAACPQG